MNWKENYFDINRFRNSGTDGKREELSGNTDIRSALESDFGRVVFSAACRRLHDKTQVFPLTTNDNIHSRLTHSLEVMNMGLSFSIDLSKSEKFLKSTGLTNIDVLRDLSAILKTACLVHDIGNPPFGHFGEVVIQNYFKELFEKISREDSLVKNGIQNTAYYTKKEEKDCNGSEEMLAQINDQRKIFQIEQLEKFLNDESWKLDYLQFDGNAEGFRNITKLQNSGDLYGLNLTFGTLAATVKYPNIGEANRDSKIGNHKHGVLYTERKELDDIAKACHMKIGEGEYIRHPLAFLMEAADSICYLVMDIDDAITKKWVKFEDVEKLVEESDENAKNRIMEVYEKVRVNNNSPRKRWMSLRTAMLGYLMEVAVKNFVDNLDSIEGGGYDHELIEHNNPFTKRLQDFTMRRILSQRDINKLETTGKSVISGLLDEYVYLLFHTNKGFRDRAKSLLSQSILFTIIDEHIHDYPDVYKEKYGDKDVDAVFEEFDLADLTAEERFRIIRDYVAGMTDKFALTHYQEISGQRLS